MRGNFWIGAGLLASSLAAAQDVGVDGIVIDQVTRLALRKAYVDLAPGGRQVVTGADGRFRFEDVGKAEEMTVRHAAYAGRKLRPAALRAGMSIALTPLGSIHGRVTDEDGDPLPSVRVLVYRRITSRGVTRLEPAATVNARRSGEYVADGLRPGTYLVWAAAGVSSPARMALPRFHPRGARPEDARVVELPAGESVAGIDVLLPWEPVYRVQGLTEDAQGEATLTRADQEIAFGEVQTSRVSRGTFRFDHVPAGTYRLTVTAGTRSAATIVRVAEDVIGLRLALRESPRVRASAAGGCRGLVLGLIPVAGGDPVRLDAGSPPKEVAPGEYRVLASSTCVLEELRFNGSPVTGPVFVAGDSDLEVTAAQRTGGAEGVVVRGAGAFVVAVQVQAPPWAALTGRVEQADERGFFVFSTLPAGEYRFVALEEEPGEWEDARVAGWRSGGVSVRVEADRRSGVILELRE